MIENMKHMYEWMGVDVGWKGLGRVVEKRMLLDASSLPPATLCSVGREKVSR